MTWGRPGSALGHVAVWRWHWDRFLYTVLRPSRSPPSFCPIVTSVTYVRVILTPLKGFGSW